MKLQKTVAIPEGWHTYAKDGNRYYYYEPWEKRMTFFILSQAQDGGPVQMRMRLLNGVWNELVATFEDLEESFKGSIAWLEKQKFWAGTEIYLVDPENQCVPTTWPDERTDEERDQDALASMFQSLGLIRLARAASRYKTYQRPPKEKSSHYRKFFRKVRSRNDSYEKYKSFLEDSGWVRDREDSRGLYISPDRKICALVRRVSLGLYNDPVLVRESSTIEIP